MVDGRSIIQSALGSVAVTYNLKSWWPHTVQVYISLTLCGLAGASHLLSWPGEGGSLRKLLHWDRNVTNHMLALQVSFLSNMSFLLMLHCPNQHLTSKWAAKSMHLEGRRPHVWRAALLASHGTQPWSRFSHSSSCCEH